ELYDEELGVSRLQDAFKKRWNRMYHVFDESFKRSASVVKYLKEPHNLTNSILFWARDSLDEKSDILLHPNGLSEDSLVENARILLQLKQTRTI
ncbi:hypothetical protein Tco_0933839, partial [Tanacetum coccineum]